MFELTILHEDAELVAVDKPAGLPTLAPDREWGPQALGVVEILERQLARRTHADASSGEFRLDGKLGVHQRLDRETSGVLVFSKNEAGATRLARAFEERKAEKRYVAGVENWFSGAKTLTHYLAPDAGGSRVVKKGHPQAKRAIAHVSERARHGHRVLIEVELETGCTHQIRVQLAAEGSPLAGDRRYGGGPARRLMLHALSLALPAERGRPALRIESPLPAIFSSWVEGDPVERLPRVVARDTRRSRSVPAVRELVAAAGPRRLALAELRWPHRRVAGRVDGLPGVVIDRYDDSESNRYWCLLGLYGDDACAHEDALADALVSEASVRDAHEPELGGVYVVRRPRQANELGDDHSELAPRAPIRGRATPEGGIVVNEDGLRYRVELGAGLQTLFFLDQRDARRRLRASSLDKRVLNLFCYTGSFSVAAGAGGARFVQSVDAAAPALDVLRENLELNDLPGPGHSVIKEDVFRFLPRLHKRGERFELIVCDPPTYAKTKHTRWTSGAGWVELAREVLGLLAPGGEALLCSNDLRMSEAAFVRHVHEGARQAGLEIRVRTQGDPLDLPSAQEGRAAERVEDKRRRRSRRHDTDVREDTAREDTVRDAGRGPWRVWARRES